MEKSERLPVRIWRGMFRIIQSIPSPKAEPFKQWQQIKEAKKKVQFLVKSKK